MGPTTRGEMHYLSLVEVARVLGVSERTVTRWIQSGKLAASKPGRDYRIPESAVRELVEATRVSPKVPAAPPPGSDPETARPPTTPMTDEPEPDFERRFEALSSAAQAHELRVELDGEYVALKRHARRLVAEAPPGEARGSLALRQANAKLQLCAVRLQAVTLLATDLNFADVGHKRQTFEEYAGTFGEYARFWREVEEQDRRAASGEASGASA